MITAPAVLLAAAFLQAGPVEIDVSILNKPARSGVLSGLTADVLQIKTADATSDVALDEVVEIRIKSAKAAESTASQIVLTDGSSLNFKSFAVSGQQVAVESESFGAVEIPLDRMRAIRFSAASGDAQKPWQSLIAEETKRDLLVIRRSSGKLDPTGGTIGGVDESTVTFLLGGEEVAVRREKVFGLIYNRPNRAGREAACVVRTVHGEALQAGQVSVKGETATVKLMAGINVQLPVTNATVFDFSRGRIRYLADMDPERQELDVSFFDVLFDDDVKDWFRFRKNVNPDGNPLRLSGREYQGRCESDRTGCRGRRAACVYWGISRQLRRSN